MRSFAAGIGGAFSVACTCLPANAADLGPGYERRTTIIEREVPVVRERVIESHVYEPVIVDEPVIVERAPPPRAYVHIYPEEHDRPHPRTWHAGDEW